MLLLSEGRAGKSCKSSNITMSFLHSRNWVPLASPTSFSFVCSSTGPGSSVGIATELRAGRFGDRIPVGGEIFLTCPDRPWYPSSLLYNGYRVFPGGIKRPGRDADPSPPLFPWSRKGRAIPLLPLWAVRPVQSLSACTRVTFTFTFLTLLMLLMRVFHSLSLHPSQGY